MTAETTQAPSVLWCDNPEHAEAGSAVPAIYRVTWPDGRFRPALACKDCLEDSLSLYVLNGDSDGRRHPALIELAGASPVRSSPADDVAVIREQAKRYLVAVYGPEWLYRAPETFAGPERWVWAVANGQGPLAATAIADIERVCAEHRRGGSGD